MSLFFNIKWFEYYKEHFLIKRIKKYNKVFE